MSRVEKAVKQALNEEGLDYILETFLAPDFVEVVGKMGGDTITLRFYDNGLVAER